MLVRFYVDCRIKPHVPPFEQIPANSVKFQLCSYTTQAVYFSVNFNIHILRCGLLGCQILFDTHTLMHQCQFFIVDCLRI